MSDSSSVVPQRLALVTGGNRGIGRGVCHQLAERGIEVLLGARDLDAGRQVADALARDTGGTLHALRLDVVDPEQVDAAATEVTERFGKLDILINNAGANYDIQQKAHTADLDGLVRETLEINTLGPWRMAKAFVPLLRRGTSPRLVNVSSEAGSLASMGAGPPAYQVSKAALNALTRTLAGELERDGILVNAICPGWVRTDMGGQNAHRSVEEGAASVVWAATLADGGPTGGFFRDGRTLPW
ncbi:MAG: SDR family oxidoreductase [Acidobacteriota bacterium]